MKTHIHLTALRAYRNSPPSDSVPGRCGIALYLSLALTFLPHALFAQSWYTVDDFQYSPGKGAYASGFAKDPTGSLIYSAGYAQDASGVYHGVAFSSGNGGTNWALMDDYIYPAGPPGSGSTYRGIAADSAGNIYATGYDLISSGSVQTWFTRRSADGGTTWSTVDTLSLGTDVTRPLAVAADAVGNVYVAGEVHTNAMISVGYIWLVRKGTSGSSWATVDQFGTQLNTQRGWIANGVLCHPTAGVFVVGRSAAPPVITKKGVIYTDVWTVRQSQDGGATWVTVDTYDPGGPGYTSWANGVGADSAGNIYVVGLATEPSGGKAPSGHWIVRKSTDGGNSWAIVDDFQPTSNLSAWATAFGTDAHGNVFVAGYANDGPSGSTQLIVRESVGGTGPWQTVDTFQYISAKNSRPTAVVGDNSGHIYVAGYGTDAAGVEHWIVRKR